LQNSRSLEIVENRNVLVSVRNQAFNQMAADESRPSRYQDRAHSDFSTPERHYLGRCRLHSSAPPLELKQK
jgi:hypothetical protein